MDRLPRTEGAFAVGLLSRVRALGRKGLIHVAATEGRAERLAAILWRLDTDVDALLFPPWDCLPYDRSSPSPRVMGLRTATLAALAAGPPRPWIVLGTADALAQRVPPRRVLAEAGVKLSVGETVNPAELGSHLARIGYVHDERVDQAGEYAVRGAVIDVFPAGYYLPVRIDHEDGRIKAIASFEAATQRTTDAFDTLRLRPVSEAILPAEHEHAAERPPGLEHRLPELFEPLETLLDYGPEAAISIEPEAADRLSAFTEQVREAYEARLSLGGSDARPLAPARLYLDEAERAKRLAGHAVLRFEAGRDEEEPAPEAPSFASAGRPWEAFRRYVAEEREAGRRIVIAGPDAGDVAAVARKLEDKIGTSETWADVVEAAPGAILSMALPIGQGFRVEPAVTVIATADVLGSRASASLAVASDRPAGLPDDDAFRIGDAVIHLQHGVGELEGLETVEALGAEPADTIRLSYAGGAKLMVPVGEIELMWRYGPMREGLALDRLGSDSWPKRRAKVEAEIGEAARALVRIAEERQHEAAPKLVPPRRDYERFVAGFPYTDTLDQHAAVQAILHDLASGRPMDRLVCGDVGFGKTEIALRAAAAAALSGCQVAVAAPTTVLARQHFGTFSRRFAELGLAVGQLSRLTSPAEARAIKARLASGELRVVVGTHALAAKSVSFEKLGLLVIDEEQRFGAADKDKLKRLGAAVHVLTMTATPIPRTMQAALAGLQSVSVLVTPPAERLPVRTFVSALDEATVRTALIRERRRGGQSFVVCPRIEDIGPMADVLRRLAPELDLRIAHGKMAAEEIDRTMVEFADGRGDVLLATNIIESGLDVPRANTIFIWRADRFGLAQLHQLRGRVGRGRARGLCYLLTDPDATIGKATQSRLDRLAALDRLGAGFAISAEDLESRGAGDLLGDTQAGHVKLIGAGLYRRLLERALLLARGTAPAEEWTPELNVGLGGAIPPDYVPEPEVRLNLYARIARTRTEREEHRLEEEITDRFGPIPGPVADLLALARLKRLCRTVGVTKIDAGPLALALTFKAERPDAARIGAVEARLGSAPVWKDGRLIVARQADEGPALAEIEAALAALGAD